MTIDLLFSTPICEETIIDKDLTSYIKTPENCGHICFAHPSSSIAWSWGPPMIEKYNALNTNSVSMNPEKNLLLVFPSWLDHSVDPNQSDDIRISLSFNTGFIE